MVLSGPAIDSGAISLSEIAGAIGKVANSCSAITFALSELHSEVLRAATAEAACDAAPIGVGWEVCRYL